jgi:SpoVK/Ycf46/Vps4 family AAA+-type ATPase
MRPSIIFFDEIDGLAPVRSSRQDQVSILYISIGAEKFSGKVLT